MTESFIQSQIIKTNTRLGWHMIKLIQTNTNGIPDLMCLKDGRVVFIEVKREGAKLRPLQEYRKKELEEKGFTVYVTDNQKFIIP